MRAFYVQKGLSYEKFVDEIDTCVDNNLTTENYNVQ